MTMQTQYKTEEQPQVQQGFPSEPKVNDIIALTARLAQVLAEEADYLEAMNIKKVGELTTRGLMTPAGLAAFARREDARSGVYSFDTEAMGAVEAAARSFGPLPSGFSDDVLPVIFSFDPRLIR